VLILIVYCYTSADCSCWADYLSSSSAALVLAPCRPHQLHHAAHISSRTAPRSNKGSLQQASHRICSFRGLLHCFPLQQLPQGVALKLFGPSPPPSIHNSSPYPKFAIIFGLSLHVQCSCCLRPSLDAVIAAFIC
jgi:hypothetical protein